MTNDRTYCLVPDCDGRRGICKCACHKRCGDCGELLSIGHRDGCIREHEPVDMDTVEELVEEFVGWWELNREGSVNRTYDYIDKMVKRMRVVMEER